ncbi:MAG TPA: DEAD/DEAH box helicase [Vicinamibacterales bacterium]|nr:DEAD/DEAH box helicase [Vicinamibacterales bacterium]
MKNPSAESAGFASLGLTDALVAAVAALGYEEPTPIQREAIPTLLSGADMLGQAATGTGKTAAFALPLLDTLSKDGKADRGRTRALVLVPTRELAMQVAEALHKYAKGSNLVVVPVYGGAPMDHQIRALRRGADIVVGTPGRVLDHLRRRTLQLGEVKVLVLDEADEMLDMGFAEDIDAIVNETPATRQTALFAATFAPRIMAIAGRHLKSPKKVQIAQEKRAAGKLPQVRQVAYIVGRGQKINALSRILDFESPKSAIVFCRTRIEVDELTDTLNAHGYGAQALHGGMMQKQRDRVMQGFRSEQSEILVATDVAARGLDIEHVSHVVNFDLPTAPEVYVHRIGRTGRIGREGVAITLVSPREQRFLQFVERLTKQKIEIGKLPTEADLRKRRMEATKDALRERITAGGLELTRELVQELADEFDLMDVAAAAIALASDGSERAIADVATEPDTRSRDRYDDRGPQRERRPAATRDAGPMTLLRISVGKEHNVRPADLVGAIAGEARVPSSVIGAIKVHDDYSLVEVPEEVSQKIIVALKATKIRGQKVTVQSKPAN